MREALRVWGSLWVALTTACGSAAKKEPTVAPTATRSSAAQLPPIAQPCNLTPVARALEEGSGFPSVYVELAAVATTLKEPSGFSGQRPAGFLNTDDLKVLRVGHVMAKLGSSATTPWDEPPSNDGSGCNKQSRFDLTITAHSVDLQKRQIKLELTIVPAPPLGTPKDAWYVPEHRQLRTTVIVGDQQPIMLGGELLSHHDTPSILVATPYILSVPEHLNELLQCRLTTLSKAREKTR